MNIEIIDKSDQKIIFVIDKTNPQFVNGLRRIFMNEIPILAVDYVDFTVNDSVLYDEVISHRLGLLPLKFKPNDFEFNDVCSCEGKGCSQCEVVMVIDKTGPGMVYSKDIKFSNPDVSVVYGNIPIVELKEGQSIKLDAVARLGFGKEHAKWNASVSNYRYYPAVKLNGSIKNPEETMRVCPKHALKLENGKAMVTTDCDLCMECIKVSDPKNMEITGDNTKFIFTVETISGLTPEEIVSQGIDILKEKVKEFKKKADKL